MDDTVIALSVLMKTWPLTLTVEKRRQTPLKQS